MRTRRETLLISSAEVDSSTDDDTTDDSLSENNMSARLRSPQPKYVYFHLFPSPPSPSISFANTNAKHRPDGIADAKYDALVAKLEKLDKLDELLRKLDTMKVYKNEQGTHIVI